MTASWTLGLALLAVTVNRDLQRAARAAGGGRALWSLSDSDLVRVLRLGPEEDAALRRARRSFDPAGVIASLARDGILHVPCEDPRYPARLAAIYDPPFALFATGRHEALDRLHEAPAVALVGSRAATAEGLWLAAHLGRELARRGAVVVSGMARGVDAAAHEGALDGGGVTVAVLGTGPDVVYPRRNAPLHRRILERGLVLSEYWPGTEAAPWRFPARNRIVAGLCDAVVVVQAGATSGALITADFALETGRPVLAVPGPPLAPPTAGCNLLLRAGAALCESVDDIVAELPDAAWEDAPSPARSGLEGLDREVHDRLRREPLRVDELVAALGVGAAQVAAAVGRLELAGLIVRGQGQRLWAAPLMGASC